LAIKPASLEVESSVAVCIETPGAGGYGPPGERDVASLVDDARSGKFSTEFMRDAYEYETD
jgi:N-methylhydantoinase B